MNSSRRIETTARHLTVLLDVNVLFALSWDQHVHHQIAHRRFAELETWYTTPVTEAGLVRLLLTEPVVGRTVRGAEALGQLDAIRQAPGSAMRWSRRISAG